MAENNINNTDFKFEIRTINKNKDDYKTNKKEKFLFEYLAKDNSFFAKLDMEEGTQGIITSNDINIFLSSKDVQKKNITEEDVINFLNKVRNLNPTDKEQAYSQMNFVDENNQRVITEDMYSYFDKQRVYSFDLKKDIVDERGNIKKGFEIFDLNGDNKLDNLELAYYDQNSDASRGYGMLNSFLSSLDRAGSIDDTPDNIITAEDKQKIYDNLVENHNKELFEKLKSLNIKDSFDKNLITPEIIALFENGVTEINFNDLLDEKGHIKRGFELFNIYRDFKLDENERIFFASGGHPRAEKKDSFTLESLINAIEAYDKFGFDIKDGYNKTDDTITSFDGYGLYKMMDASNYLLKNISHLPDDLQEKYRQSLTEVYLGDHKSKRSVGHCIEDFISVTQSGTNQDEIASVLIHELTHYLLGQNGMQSGMLQEVETFYMEYKLYQKTHNNPKFNTPNMEALTGQGLNIINDKYITFVEKMKKDNPEMSEKEIAVEAFIKYHYDSYKDYYKDKLSPDDLRKLALETNNFVYLK